MSAEPAETREASAEDAYQAFVWRHLRRNYSAHLLHGLFGQTGFRLINLPTFVPTYIHLLTGSDLAVGLARSLQSLGMFLSPIVGASVIESRRRVLPVGFLTGALMRVQVLGIALAGFFLEGPIAIYAILGFFLLFGVFLGMQGVIFNFLMSKTIPVTRRGVLLGLRNTLAGLTGTVVAGIGGYLIAEEFLGNGYASTFLLSFVLTSIGLFMLLLVKEPEPPEVREQSRLADRLKELPALLRDDRAFTLYFLARALATMGRMAMPFYILYAESKLPLSGVSLGVLSMSFAIANSTVNLVWGSIADRTGFRFVFISALAIWVASALLLMASEGLWPTAAVFFGLGAGLGGFMMAGQNMVLEFGEREDLPMRIAVANSSSELVGALGPLLAGALAVAFSYVAVFWTAIAFQLAAIAVVWVFVDEPRRREA